MRILALLLVLLAGCHRHAVLIERGHVHTHHCGHFFRRGHWYHSPGHVHAHGCGHAHRDGLWVVVD